jgi:hypothetical protein
MHTHLAHKTWITGQNKDTRSSKISLRKFSGLGLDKLDILEKDLENTKNIW